MAEITTSASVARVDMTPMVILGKGDNRIFGHQKNYNILNAYR